MKTFITIFLVVVFGQNMLGQQINGRITDKKNHGIAGALISLGNTGNHEHTDNKGNFSVRGVNPEDSLYITALGFQSFIFPAKGAISPINISLNKGSISLNEVTIVPDIEAINLFANVNLLTNPVNNSQELMRKVPGLVIGQHAGGGKAEQFFLRGFDIDHGTDIAISVDGMPVNMVSHAHGQGYADLHFVIPETVEKLNFGKGPYYADQGNFNTAAFVDMQLKKRLDRSLIRTEIGQFNSQRLVGMFNLLNEDGQAAYVATEFIATDGPFESSQNFRRVNVMGRYTGTLQNNDQIGLTTSYFTSVWDASGQIPQRAVDQGRISRFGAIDSTEGGETSRGNVSLDYTKVIDARQSVKTTAYFSAYDFLLYSNFTFFLEDSINGDQIRQREERQMFGFKSEYNNNFSIGSVYSQLRVGISYRNDRSQENELSHTQNRSTTLDRIQFGNINETNYGAFASLEFGLGRFSVTPGIRFDRFDFVYNDLLQPNYSNQGIVKEIVSPKLNFLYNANNKTQVYLSTGKGFHSNDTRTIIAQTGEDILPAAYGADFGLIWKPESKLILNAALWYLFLEQEFVYVGDAGIVEPGGQTQRTGVDFSARYQPLKWLFVDADVNYAFARSVDDPEGENYIPLAPDLTVMGGFSAIHSSGFYGGLRVRHIEDRPANEDNSIVAIGYTVIDFNVGKRWDRLDIGIKIQNLFDVDWNETQFATESRLQDEPAPVEEIHFTPGTPFFASAVLSYSF